MLFNFNTNNLWLNIKFNCNLMYYQYFNPYAINHYNLINKLNSYTAIASSYYKKYPTAKVFSNNEELFEKNPKAQEEYRISSLTQEEIKKSIINDINCICKCVCKQPTSYNICSEQFHSFYIKDDYHIEQNIDSVVYILKQDIINNNIDL